LRSFSIGNQFAQSLPSMLYNRHKKKKIKKNSG
jgi:hypothetical protein